MTLILTNTDNNWDIRQYIITARQLMCIHIVKNVA